MGTTTTPEKPKTKRGPGRPRKEPAKKATKEATAANPYALEESRLPLNEIRMHAAFKNSRTVLTNLGDLVADVQEKGILTPLIVWEVEDGVGRLQYFLISGFRRRAALEHIQNTQGYTQEVPVRIFRGDAKAACAINLSENVQREELTPIEVCEYLEYMVTQGYSQVELTNVVGKSPAWVSAAIKFVVNAVEELLDCVRQGKMSYSAAMNVAALEPDSQREAVSAYMTTFETKGKQTAATNLNNDTNPKKKKITQKNRRPADQLADKYNAYSSMDVADLKAVDKAFVFGVQKGLLWALNREVDFTTVASPALQKVDLAKAPTVSLVTAPEDEAPELPEEAAGTNGVE